MYKPLRFRDEFSKTSLSAFKTLFFCATNHFIIPHDVVGAILYAEALTGVEEVTFDDDVLKQFTPSLITFVPDAKSYLNAIKSMGYQDIVDEFNLKQKKVRQFVKKHIAQGPYNVDIVRKKVESIVPLQYMTIIKNHLFIMNTRPKLSENDEIFEDAARLVIITQYSCINDIRSKLGLTYKKARKVMERLINAGIVGPLDDNETAEVLITNYSDLESILSKSLKNK